MNRIGNETLIVFEVKVDKLFGQKKVRATIYTPFKQRSRFNTEGKVVKPNVMRVDRLSGH